MLVKFHEKGMTGTGKQCEGLLLEASQESGLPLQTVKVILMNNFNHTTVVLKIITNVIVNSPHIIETFIIADKSDNWLLSNA